MLVSRCTEMGQTSSSVFDHIPYDIFREIILYAYASVPDPYHPEETSNYECLNFDLPVVMPPIAASHVCRAWRNSLLSDPIMWTCIPIPQIKPQGILQLLPRSGSALLNVFINLGQYRSLYCPPYTERMLSSLFDQIHRFKILHVRAHGRLDVARPRGVAKYHIRDLNKCIALVMSYLQKPAPNLQTFGLWHHQMDHCLKENFSHTLFSGNAPNLKQLHYEFTTGFPELHCPLFQNLSELHLSLPSGIHFDRVLDLLDLSPGLKFLRIVDRFFMSLLPSKSVSNRTVNLPALERLVLDTNSFEELVLGHLTFPGTTSWHVSTQHWPGAGFSMEFLQLLRSARFTILEAKFLGGGGLLLSLKEEERDVEYINRFNDRKLVCFYPHLSQFIEDWEVLMDNIKSTSRISHLNLDFYPLLTCGALPKVFTSLQDLKTLTIIRKGETLKVDCDYGDDPLLWLSLTLSELI